MVDLYRSLLPTTVGFDRLFSTINEFDHLLTEGKKYTQSYPPYNIIKTDDTNYSIEIAVAGFKREELDISFENSKLIVTGKTFDVAEKEYLHKGIGTRDFTHNFRLSDSIIIKSADIVDGLLVISLVNIIPEEKKPRKILIGN